MVCPMEGQASPLKKNQPLSKKGGARPGAGRKPGVPNKATAEIREAAQQYTTQALETLAQVMQTGESETARVSAANSILDRAYGRPAQAVQLGGHDGGPIKHLHELSDDVLAKIALGRA